MRFHPLTETDAVSPQSALLSEYRAARTTGRIRVGELHLFFRSGFKTYCIPYRDIRRCFRRVMLIPAKMRSGQCDLKLETIVICGEQGELAQIQLPGESAGKQLMEELQSLVPEAEFGKPSSENEIS